MIPSNIACKDNKNIDWGKIANHVECAIPLPLLMNLDDVRLINKDGK